MPSRKVVMETEQCVLPDAITVGTVLEVETSNRVYKVEGCANGQALISGHPMFCPDPIVVKLVGSTWGGAMGKTGSIGRAMRLEFWHPVFGIVFTSRIQQVRKLSSK